MYISINSRHIYILIIKFISKLILFILYLILFFIFFILVIYTLI